MESRESLKGRFKNRLGSVKYIACMDAGASKVAFQLFTLDGEVISIHKEQPFSLLTGKGASLTNLSKEQVFQHLQEMFQEAYVEKGPLSTFFADTLLICGAAGVEREASYIQFDSILSDLGFRKENILLCSDAALLLSLVRQEGAVVIGGTGSICLGKKGEKVERVGGLGRFLGDEGSGHDIGLEAIKAVLSYEYGWGKDTSLVSSLQSHFEKDSLSFLIPMINKAEIPAAEIAKVASYVFAGVEKGDSVSLEILEKAVSHITELLTKTLGKLELKEPTVYLYGGLFHSPHFYQKTEEKLRSLYGGISLVNLQSLDLTTLVIQQFLSEDFCLEQNKTAKA